MKSSLTGIRVIWVECVVLSSRVSLRWWLLAQNITRDISNHGLAVRAWFETIVTCYAVLELSDRTFNLTSSSCRANCIRAPAPTIGVLLLLACTSGCGRHDVNTMSVEAEDSFEHTSHIYTHRDVVCTSPDLVIRRHKHHSYIYIYIYINKLRYGSLYCVTWRG